MNELDFDLEQLFRRRFRAGIFFLQPNDCFVLERQGRVYAFPAGTTEQQINSRITQSLREARNLLYDDVRANEIFADADGIC